MTSTYSHCREFVLRLVDGAVSKAHSQQMARDILMIRSPYEDHDPNWKSRTKTPNSATRSGKQKSSPAADRSNGSIPMWAHDATSTSPPRSRPSSSVMLVKKMKPYAYPPPQKNQVRRVPHTSVPSSAMASRPASREALPGDMSPGPIYYPCETQTTTSIPGLRILCPHAGDKRGDPIPKAQKTPGPDFNLPPWSERKNTCGLKIMPDSGPFLRPSTPSSADFTYRPPERVKGVVRICPRIHEPRDPLRERHDMLSACNALKKLEDSTRVELSDDELLRSWTEKIHPIHNSEQQQQHQTNLSNSGHSLVVLEGSCNNTSDLPKVPKHSRYKDLVLDPSRPLRSVTHSVTIPKSGNGIRTPSPI
eukprot:PhF_6_TR4427/c0_g1_i1/m.5989